MTSKSVQKRLQAQQGNASLTDDKIDRLSGVELQEAVLASLGWTRDTNITWLSPDGQYIHYDDRPKYHTDKGAALDLLMSGKQFVKICFSEGLVVYGSGGEILSSGSKLNAAEYFCRAFLKLTQRKES